MQDIATPVFGNGYSEFYVGYLDSSAFAVPKGPATGAPVCVKSENLRAEVRKYLSKNYQIMGESAFVGPLEDDKSLLQHAKQISAQVVVYKTSYAETKGRIKRYAHDATFLALPAQKRPLGVVFGDLDTKFSGKTGRTAPGVLVVALVKGGAAETAGLRENDVVVSVDGKLVDSAEALRLAITGDKSTRPSRPCLEVERNGNRIKVDL